MWLALRTAPTLFVVGLLTVCSSVPRVNAEIVTLTGEKIAAGCGDPCPRHALVFIHGIWGSEDTWRNLETNAYWPALVAADPELADFDVYRLNYETFYLSSGPSLNQIMTAMLVQMDPVLKKGYTSMLFIAHSLGGIVLQNYFIELKFRSMHKELSLIRLGILLGTPSNGSHWADVAQRLGGGSAALRVLGDISRNDILQLFQNGIVRITEKHEGLGCPSLRLYGAYEEKPTHGVMIAPKETAAVGLYRATQPVESPKGFERDHSSIAKPRDTLDEIYTWTKALLRDCGDAKDVCPAPRLPLPPDCYFELRR